MISSINGRTTQKCIGKSNNHWLVMWKVSVCQYKGSHLLKNSRISDHCCALLIVSLAITVISRVRPSVPIKHEQSSNAGQHYPFFAILPLFSQIYPQHFASLGLFKFVTHTHAQICDQIALNSHFALIMPIFHAPKTVHLASPGSPWQGGRFLNFVRGGFPF